MSAEEANIHLTELNLREKAEQFTRPILGDQQGREREAPGDLVGGFSPTIFGAGPPSIEGNDPPIERVNPFTPRKK